MSKSRVYVFTLNNYNDISIALLSGLVRLDKAKYICYGKEVGEEGTPHLQGLVQFHHQKSKKAANKILGNRCYLEEKRGTFQQAIAYCEKDGDFIEFGPRPLDNQTKGQITKDKWETAKTLASEGKIEEISPDLYIKYYRTFKLIAKDNMADVEDAADVTGVWYYGEAGAGKSRTARQDFPGAYLKMCNKWWDGYADEENVIVDDFDRKHDVLAHHLKIWMDRYCFLAEVKGYAIKIRPKVICVTSQYHPNDIWSDEETRAAILRRVKIKHFIQLQ